MWFYARNVQSEGISLVSSRLRFPPRGNGESMIHSDMVRGLVPSMVKCKGWAIMSWWEDWFLPCQIWVLSHSNVTIVLVPTWSNISVECHYLNGGTWLVTRNTQLGVEMPFSRRMEAPGQLPGILSLGLRAILTRCVYTWSDVSEEPFWQDEVGCEWWAFLTWVLDVFLPWSDLSDGRAFLTWFLNVFLPWSDVSDGNDFLTWFIPWLDISVEYDKDLHEG